MSDFIRQNAINSSFTLNESWIILSEIEQSIKRKVEASGTPLGEWDIKISRGLLTGCNEAYIIDRNIREKILSTCKDEAEYKRTDEIIRPILRGRDIKKGKYEWAGLYIISTHNGYSDESGHYIERININRYPALKDWFNNGNWNQKPEKGTNIERLATRTDRGDTPYNLRDCAYMDDFSRQKIVFPAIMSQDAFFAVDKEGYVVVAPGNTLIGNIDFDSLLIYLCSVGYWALKHFYMGGGIEGELKVNRLMKLPIPNNLDKIQTVDDIYSELDFSEEEIRLISSSSK